MLRGISGQPTTPGAKQTTLFCRDNRGRTRRENGTIPMAERDARTEKYLWLRNRRAGSGRGSRYRYVRRADARRRKWACDCGVRGARSLSAYVVRLVLLGLASASHAPLSSPSSSPAFRHPKPPLGCSNSHIYLRAVTPRAVAFGTSAHSPRPSQAEHEVKPLRSQNAV